MLSIPFVSTQTKLSNYLGETLMRRLKVRSLSARKTNTLRNLCVLCVSVVQIFLSACAQPTPVPPAGTFAPQLRDQPTLPPPTWTESAEEIALQNVERIAYLGRLDANTTPSTVFAYAFSPDGTRLAGLNNEQLIGWDLVSGRLVFNTARSEAVFVYYGADKSEVYTVNNSGVISIYDAETGAFKDSLEGQQAFNGIATYYADDGYLALGGIDGKVKVWDVAQRLSVVTIEAHRLQITALAFDANGERLATASDDQVVKIWDWRSRTQQLEVKATAVRMAFAPDGSQFAVGEFSQIQLFNAQDGSVLFTLNTGPGAVKDVLIYSPDSQYVLNGGDIPAMTVWDARTGALANQLPGVGGETMTAAFSPNGDILATAVLGGNVSLWDMNTIRAQTLNRADLNVGTRQILYADWTSDGFSLTLFDGTGPIQVWGIPAAAEATATP